MRTLIVFVLAAGLGSSALSQNKGHDVGAGGQTARLIQQQSDFANNPADALYQVKSASNSGWTNTWRSAWAGCMTQQFLMKYKPAEWIVQIDSTVESVDQSMCSAAVNMIPKNPASMPTQFYSSVRVSAEKFTATEKTRRKYSFEEACVKEAFQKMVDGETRQAPGHGEPCSLGRLR